MRLGIRELRHNWKKYLLVEIIVVLMMFMVLFLSGLVKGLGRAVSSGIDNMKADTFILKEDAEKQNSAKETFRGSAPREFSEACRFS